VAAEKKDQSDETILGVIKVGEDFFAVPHLESDGGPPTPKPNGILGAA
jgi:hypothetical protein